jgi:hypothetical protein
MICKIEKRVQASLKLNFARQTKARFHAPSAVIVCLNSVMYTMFSIKTLSFKHK